MVRCSGGSRNGAIGGAVGWRGGRGRGPPTHQQGGMGERCKLPHQGLARSPRSFHIFRFKAAKNQRIRSAVKEFTYARKTTKFIATTRLVRVVNRRPCSREQTVLLLYIVVVMYSGDRDS